MTISTRLDAVAARLARVRLPLSARLAIEEAAAAVSAEKLSDAEGDKMGRHAEKFRKPKDWIEITTQPKKKGKSWIARVTFIYKGDREKTKHNVPIPLPGPAKLKLKNKKGLGAIWVQPKDKTRKPYFLGDLEVEDPGDEDAAEDKPKTSTGKKGTDDAGTFSGKKPKPEAPAEDEAPAEKEPEPEDDAPAGEGGEDPGHEEPTRLPPPREPEDGQGGKGSEDELGPPMSDSDGDGVDDQARVGVPSDALPPDPPVEKIPRLPNLTDEEKAIEGRFADAFEAAPAMMVGAYADSVAAIAEKKGAPPTFVTDDTKVLTDDYTPKGTPEEEELFDTVHELLDEGMDHKEILASLKPHEAEMYNQTREHIAETRAKNNTLLHQTANAIAKRAFVEHLDKMAEMDDDDPKKSVLVTSGGCGCHAVNSPLMMSDGSVKMAQDIHLGDKLMGPDSKPREVQCTIQGKGPLYMVWPTKGTPFVVNDDHVLSLRILHARGSKKRTKKITVEMTVKEYLSRGKSFQRLSYLYRTGVDFPSRTVAVDSYFLGLWLGDGTHCSTAVTTADSEVAEAISDYSEEIKGTKVTVHPKPNNKASVHQIVRRVGGGTGCANLLLRAMRGLDVLSNKHIPDAYLKNDRDTRLQMLAGLLDSDGSLTNNCYDFISKIRNLSEQVVWLARSLGLAAYMTPTTKSSQTGYTGTYYRVSISGHTDEIPVRVTRKKATEREQRKDVLHTGFKVEALGEGRYYGFTLGGDGLYLMEDFTVTHNSGKGFALKNAPDSEKDKVSGVGAIWDAAGEQNGTENPWIMEECRKRGIKAKFLFVDSDPKQTWSGPWGVMNRAKNPPPDGEGRMVDARLFADSYAKGAKNFKAFHDDNKDKDDAEFIMINSRDGLPPKVVSEVSKEALSLDADKLYEDSMAAVQKDAPTEAIKEGATKGSRIWKSDGKAEASVTATVTASEWLLAAGFVQAEDEGDEDVEDSEDTTEGVSDETQALAESLARNMGYNAENQPQYFAQKWMDQREIEGRRPGSSDDSKEEEADDEVEASVSARMDGVADRLSTLRLPSTVLLAVEEAALSATKVRSGSAKYTKQEYKKAAVFLQKQVDKMKGGPQYTLASLAVDMALALARGASSNQAIRRFDSLKFPRGVESQKRDGKETYAFIMELMARRSKRVGASSVYAAKRPTFKMAQKTLMDYLDSEGWTVKTGLKIPWAERRDGRVRVWFKAQAIWIGPGGRGANIGQAQSTWFDPRAETPESFMKEVEDWEDESR